MRRVCNEKVSLLLRKILLKYILTKFPTWSLTDLKSCIPDMPGESVLVFVFSGDNNTDYGDLAQDNIPFINLKKCLVIYI